MHLRAEARAGTVRLPDGVSLPDKDERILRGAISSRATHLLTGDRKAFGSFYGRELGGVLVQRPADYLRARA